MKSLRVVSCDWSESETKELLDSYLSHMPNDMLSKYFRRSQRDIVRALASLVLGETYVSTNSRAESFGKAWSWRDDQILVREYQIGKSVAQIAAVLGRDNLGVAFRILGTLTPKIPQHIVHKYGLTSERRGLSPLQGDELQPVRLCSQCFGTWKDCDCEKEQQLEQKRLGH